MSDTRPIDHGLPRSEQAGSDRRAHIPSQDESKFRAEVKTVGPDTAYSFTKMGGSYEIDPEPNHPVNQDRVWPERDEIIQNSELLEQAGRLHIVGY